MKNLKALSLVFALLMAFSVLSFTAFAEEAQTQNQTQTGETTQDPSTTDPTEPSAPEENTEWEYKELTDTTIEITAYKGNAAKCVIPDKINGKEVVSLASGVITNNAEINEIVIPGSIIEVKADSFIGCINLKTITVEKGKLQSFDIEFCQSLETVNLPENVKTIGKFEHCTSLKAFNIDSKNATYKSANGVVYSKDGKTLIKYPAGKVSTRFVIPSSVTAIADYAFEAVGSSIKEIFVPTSVVKMGENAFKDAVPAILFQAAKVPDGCTKAVTGKTVKCDQINVYAPKKVTSAQNANAIKLSWDKVVGATSYALYYKNAKGAWVHYGNIAATEYTFTKLPAGTKYTFAVRSVVKTASGKLVGSSNYITYQAATAPVATKKIVNTKTDSTIKITWETVKGADGYAIYYKVGKGNWVHAGNTTKNTATFKNLKGYTQYSFAVRTLVRASDKIVAGAHKEVTIRTNLETPKVTASQSAANTVSFTWSSSLGASHYQVFYKVNNGSWVHAGTYDKVASAKIPKVTKGVQLSLTVRALRVENGKTVEMSAYTPVTVTVK